MARRRSHRHAWRCATALLMVLPCAGTLAQVRQFPDTSDGIYVYADQLPGGLTEAQVQFAARSYVGSQKLLPRQVQVLRAVNPDFMLLHYRLALGAADLDYITGEDWGNDWAEVSRHDNWFVTNAAGQRLRQTEWNWYVMDPSGQISGAGDQGWKEYFADTCLAQMRVMGADGVFADSYSVSVINDQLLDPSDARFAGTNPLTTWIPHLDTFGRYVQDRFHATPEQFHLIVNCGQLITIWDTTDFSIPDGVMVEGFGYADDYGDWQLEMNAILSLQRQGKVVIGQEYLDSPADVQRRLFLMGCYLLAKGQRMYLNMLGTGGVALEWYPEYTIDLGPPTMPPAAEVSEYYDAASGLYRRDYARGVVLVNPREGQRTVDLGRSYQRIVPQGGGAVGEDGIRPGSLGTVAEQNVTLAPYSAAILLADGGAGAEAPPRPETQPTPAPGPAAGGLQARFRHGQAAVLAEVPEGSSAHLQERAVEAREPTQRNFIIEDGGAAAE